MQKARRFADGAVKACRKGARTDVFHEVSASSESQAGIRCSTLPWRALHGGIVHPMGISNEYPVQHPALESTPRGYRAPDGHFKRVSGAAPCPGEHSTGVSCTRCFLRGRDRKKALLLRFACGPFPVCRGRRLFFSHSSPPAVNLVVSSSQFAVFPVYLPKPRLAILPPVSILRYGVVAGAAARPAAEDAFDA